MIAKRTASPGNFGAASKRLGALGECLAWTALTLRGYKVLVKNFRSPRGEIDLVARQSETLVFIEVKTRRRFGKGEPVESITSHKRSQMIRAARYYLARYDQRGTPCRFDVVSIVLDGWRSRCEVIENAFLVEEDHAGQGAVQRRSWD